MGDYEEYFRALERNTVAPLNRDRVKKILEKNGWFYQVNQDGNLAGAWENGIYLFEITGDKDSVLCVRGTWRGNIDLDDFILVNSLCNRWNTEYYWPKTFARVTDNRELIVHTELPISYHGGLTDSQLDEQIHCALESSEDFFGHLGEQFPQSPSDLGDSQEK